MAPSHFDNFQRCTLLLLGINPIMINNPVPPEAFLESGREITRRGKKFLHHRKKDREIGAFNDIFGTVPSICSLLWTMVDPLNTISRKSRIFHLLWALLLMNDYSTEVINASYVGVDVDTFRKWTHLWILAISQLSTNVIKWENRFLGNWFYWTFSVDGIHCPIQEPSPFWKGWCSHKFKGAGLSYEVCVGVSSGYIVWVRGPFPAGRWSDLKIFDRELIANIMQGHEKGVADRGYRGRPPFLVIPWWQKYAPSECTRIDRILGRHEQVNSRLKHWNCLSNEFRHDRDNHQKFFMAVAVVVQLEIEHQIVTSFEI
jgi:hypothetical protein